MGSFMKNYFEIFRISNEESGDHFTPRDVVKLLVSLVFGGEKKSKIGYFNFMICCCGTGGMLTIGKEWINEKY